VSIAKQLDLLSVPQFEEVFRKLPKTEIHVHLEAIMGVDSIWAMIQENKLSIPGISSHEDVEKKFKISSLNEFIDLYINVIQNVIRKSSDLNFLIKDARDYLQENNIRYAEIFFSPTKYVLNGISFNELVDTLENGANVLQKQTGIDIRFILDVSRSYGVENAENNLKLLLEHPVPRIIGIGLGGAEQRGPAGEYADVFEDAMKAGYKVVAHAGEDVGPESIWAAIEDLKAARIGHGISAVDDPKLMDFLKEKQIPLEICPTSNVFTRKFVQSFEEHPIREFYDKGLYVTLNTDDPTIFGVNLIEEYVNLYRRGLFKPSELVDILKNNISATFLPEKKKRSFLASIDKELEASISVP
jgi:adenosine deaminase